MKKKLFFITILFSMTIILSAQSRPVVQDIQAQASKGTRINISWTLPSDPLGEITKLLIYRDTKPISAYISLREPFSLQSFLPGKPATPMLFRITTIIIMQ